MINLIDCETRVGANILFYYRKLFFFFSFCVQKFHLFHGISLKNNLNILKSTINIPVHVEITIPIFYHKHTDQFLDLNSKGKIKNFGNLHILIKTLNGLEY